jgi:membrane protease YdiL (CAAX protease family)
LDIASATARSRWVGWLAVLIASDAVDICWEWHSGQRLPLGFELLRAGLLVPIALWTSGYLRSFVITLIAFLSGSWMERLIEHRWEWFQHASVSMRMSVDAGIALIPSTLIALTLIGSGFTRKDIFLTAGNLRARFACRGWVRWYWLAPLVSFLLIFGLSAQLKFIFGDRHAAVPPNWISLVFLSLGFAAINAANEEFRFRFALLARGRRAFGDSTALWMTSLNFGLAHWVSGHPGGPTGAVTTTLFGLLLACSIFDTEGGLWAWLMHVAGDVIILVVVLMRVG